ncbi:MAG TPA: tripartite tricarboxylate transporter substrate binding protein [Burkholderiales bacterium]|nr:tripartite tricarboxylate transporter substrate binding protein [Burkholderiales bacterium]
MRLRLSPLVVSTSLCAFIPLAASAQTYPTKSVRLVSPFPPGSSADFNSRLFGPKLSELLGQQFVVDNRPGAAGNIGAELVARSAPDGYTLLTAPASLATSAPLYKKLTFDFARDFEPVAMLTSSPHVLAVRLTLPPKTVKELVALMKAKPGQVTYASTGVGSSSHLTMELFRLSTGIEFVHVPYKGSANTVPDLIGGQVDMTMSSAISLLPHIRAGRIRALAITSLNRSPVAPDLPTIAESGYPGFESETWAALLGPAGLPKRIVGQLSAAISTIAKMPDILERITLQGARPRMGTPEEARTFIRAETAKWAKVIAEAGIRIE